MINQKAFVNALQRSGVNFFCGVPDSYLNGFCTYLSENIPAGQHIITANEGSAVALASGHYFITGNVPLVYMQNSGMGNALNPLASLVDKHVYAVPMILLIGWRGDPSGKDHEQHKTQGEITLKLLALLGIPYSILQDNDSMIDEAAFWAAKTALETGVPTALVVQKGVCAENEKNPSVDNSYPMSREDAIRVILNNTSRDTIFVATTGRATRELYFLRDERAETHNYDILNVGSMGHASSIAMGIALARRDRLVICLDGDSAAIMHMGALTTVGRYHIPNYLHIVLNNGAHESVGGQPSAGHRISFEEIARGSGSRAKTVDNAQALADVLLDFSSGNTASFIDVRIRQGMRPVLPPLKINHQHLIRNFMDQNSKKEIGESWTRPENF